MSHFVRSAVAPSTAPLSGSPPSRHSPSLSNDRPRRRTRKWPKTPCKTTTGDSTFSGEICKNSMSSFAIKPQRTIIYFPAGLLNANLASTHSLTPRHAQRWSGTLQLPPRRRSRANSASFNGPIKTAAAGGRRARAARKNGANRGRKEEREREGEGVSVPPWNNPKFEPLQPRMRKLGEETAW